MSKMNFKSTLWALAFACAAVSCSDDLENGPNNNNENEEQGEGVYVTVNVSSAFNPVTKAGEDGDGDLEDSDKESAVNDINIYLIPNQSQTEKITTNDLSIVNEDGETSISGGYSTDLEAATGTIDHHDAKATVKISVPDLNNYYHVVAVVNAGEELKFTKLAQLRDYLQTKLWEGENKYDVATNFVMTTHQMYQDDAGGSDLFVSQENSDPAHPAETTVYVERLAARVDLQVADALVSDVGASLSNNSDEASKVKLTGYQVVNQLVGGTYMLKRVSGNVTSVTGALVTAVDPEPFYPYLGDELYTSGKYNYVIDPWTGNKTYTATEGTSFPVKINNDGVYYTRGENDFTQNSENSQEISLKNGLYKNHFDEDLNGQKGFMTFNVLTDIKKTTEDNGAFSPLLYTGENTMDVDQQKNGFSTGVIFESEFKPQYVSLYEEGNGAVTDQHLYTAGNAFFVANYDHSGTSGNGGSITTTRTLSHDLRTIAALGLKTGSDIDIVKYMFNSTFTWPDGKGQTDIQTVVNGMSGGKLVIAFKEYLQKELDKVTEENPFTNVQGNLTWNKFVDASHTASNGIAYVPSETELANGISGETPKTNIVVREELMNNYSIAYYAAGTFGAKNYLKYWIKHEPQAESVKDMGVMEYAIVRNNVYQLQVNGIKDLGDPLPFTPGVDDPDNPNRETDVFILVNLYVRNWVKRSNGNIIL